MELLKERKCYLCGRTNRLERHHVFNAANRKLSEKYGAVVWLCGEECHRTGPKSVHMNAQVMRKLKADIQQKLMDEQGWTVEDFRKVFVKSYV